MKYCHHCGESLAEQVRFCRNCGTPLTTSAKSSSQSMNKSHSSFSNIPSFPAHKHKSVVRDIPRTFRKTISLSPQISDAIIHTIFVVSANFAKEMQKICISLGLDCSKIIYDSNPSQIIKKCQDTLKKSVDGSIKYVCIIGNWDEVPPSEIPNTMLDDGDDFCLTDAFYGSKENFDSEDPFTAIPEFPVGRIPLSDSDVIYRILTHSPVLSTEENAFLFGVTADCWSEATHDIISSFPNLPPGAPLFIEPSSKGSISRSAMLCSPVWDEKTLGKTIGEKIQNESQIILFNVHGSADDPEWVGEGERYEYVHVFSPGTIPNYNSALIVSEACYGGAIDYDEMSIVEHFFLNGGCSFVGSSTIAYGSPSPPICAADLLAKYYINGLYQGLTQGVALNQAKLEAISDDYMAIEEGLKTILSFNLFGAPWQSLTKRGSTLTDPTQVSSPGNSSILDRIRANLNSNARALPQNSLHNIRESYRRRLPERSRQFIIEKENLLNMIREFHDFTKIESSVKSWGGRIEDINLKFIKAGEKEGYRLFCRGSGGKKSHQALILLLDQSGQIKKTIMSKGDI